MRLATAVLAICLTGVAAAQDAVGTRIAQSAAAAERLQGSLDGTWTLQDRRGHDLFVVQIGDPPSGGRTLACAWRSPDGTGRLAKCQRRGATLTIAFKSIAKRRVVLHRAGTGVWRGEILSGSAPSPVTLHRG